MPFDSDSMSKKEVGKRIDRIRVQRGFYSINQLAAGMRVVGIPISSSTIQNIVKGESYPGGRALIGLAMALGVTVDWILTGTNGFAAPVTTGMILDEELKLHGVEIPSDWGSGDTSEVLRRMIIDFIIEVVREIGGSGRANETE